MIDYNEAWKTRKGERYEKGPASFHKHRVLLTVIETIKLNVESILDIGCGDGSFLKVLAWRLPQTRLYGADISDEAIHQAKEKIDCLFFVCNIEEDFPPINVDLVTCNDVLEHCVDDQKSLKNISKTTRYLLLTVPTGKKLDRYDKSSGHVRLYTEPLLKRKLEHAGFTVLFMKEWGFPFYDLLRSIKNIVGPMYEVGVQGKLTFFQRAVGFGLRYLMYLNCFNKGGRIFALCERGTKDENRNLCKW